MCLQNYVFVIFFSWWQILLSDLLWASNLEWIFFLWEGQALLPLGKFHLKFAVWFIKHLPSGGWDQGSKQMLVHGFPSSLPIHKGCQILMFISFSISQNALINQSLVQLLTVSSCACQIKVALLGSGFEDHTLGFHHLGLFPTLDMLPKRQAHGTFLYSTVNCICDSVSRLCAASVQ